LSSRGSHLFDTAYSYHKCGGVTAAFAEVTGYPDCESAPLAHTYQSTISTDWNDRADTMTFVPPLEITGDVAPTADALSPDAFFIDVNLYLGIPSAIIDSNSAGGFQAWQVSAFSSMADQNCTGTYADSNVAGWGWAYGFWSGIIPYVAHSEIGYDPTHPGEQGKWLAEFGVTMPAGMLPAFAFSIMPKLIPLISPNGLGSNFPGFIMGEDLNAGNLISDIIGDPVGRTTSSMDMLGKGSLYTLVYYAHAWYNIYLYCGVYLLVYSFFPVLTVALYRFKADSKMLG